MAVQQGRLSPCHGYNPSGGGLPLYLRHDGHHGAVACDKGCEMGFAAPRGGHSAHPCHGRECIDIRSLCAQSRVSVPR